MIVIVITIVGLMVARTILVIPAELVVLKNQVTKRMQLCITEWGGSNLQCGHSDAV